MHSIQPGTYAAKDQPEIVVLYGGRISDQPNGHGPWVQWRFPWESDNQHTDTLWFHFKRMLTEAGYELKEASEGIDFQH